MRWPEAVPALLSKEGRTHTDASCGCGFIHTDSWRLNVVAPWRGQYHAINSSVLECVRLLCSLKANATNCPSNPPSGASGNDAGNVRKHVVGWAHARDFPNVPERGT